LDNDELEFSRLAYAQCIIARSKYKSTDSCVVSVLRCPNFPYDGAIRAIAQPKVRDTDAVLTQKVQINYFFISSALDVDGRTCEVDFIRCQTDGGQHEQSTTG
jgi:hypothetical protein